MQRIEVGAHHSSTGAERTVADCCGAGSDVKRYLNLVLQGNQTILEGMYRFIAAPQCLDYRCIGISRVWARTQRSLEFGGDPIWIELSESISQTLLILVRLQQAVSISSSRSLVRSLLSQDGPACGRNRSSPSMVEESRRGPGDGRAPFITLQATRPSRCGDMLFAMRCLKPLKIG